MSRTVMAVNATLCATLLTVFPVLYLVFLVETRAVGSSYRQKNPYTWSVGIGTPLSFFGVVITAVGVQADGLTGWWAGMAWVFFAGAMLSLGAVSALVILTWDREDGRSSWIFGLLSGTNGSGGNTTQANPTQSSPTPVNAAQASQTAQTSGTGNNSGGGTV